jgi:hypothetical protein
VDRIALERVQSGWKLIFERCWKMQSAVAFVLNDVDLDASEKRFCDEKKHWLRYCDTMPLTVNGTLLTKSNVLEIFKRCKNLKALDWRANTPEMMDQHFGKELFFVCPDLEHLSGVTLTSNILCNTRRASQVKCLNLVSMTCTADDQLEDMLRITGNFFKTSSNLKKLRFEGAGCSFSIINAHLKGNVPTQAAELIRDAFSDFLDDLEANHPGLFVVIDSSDDDDYDDNDD